MAGEKRKQEEAKKKKVEKVPSKEELEMQKRIQEYNVCHSQSMHFCVSLFILISVVFIEELFPSFKRFKHVYPYL